MALTINCETCGIKVENPLNNGRLKYCKRCAYQKVLKDNRNRRNKNNPKYVIWFKQYIKRKNYKDYQIKYKKSQTGKLKISEYKKTEKFKLTRKKSVWKRRAKIKTISHTFTVEEWNKKKDETNGICPGCNTFIGINKLTLDHIYPLGKAEEGQVYTIDDVQPLCKSCNSSKGIN